MTVNRCASWVCTVSHVVELSPTPWIIRIAGPDPATRKARRYPWMVRNCSDGGATSRTGCRWRLEGFRIVFSFRFGVRVEEKLPGGHLANPWKGSAQPPDIDKRDVASIDTPTRGWLMPRSKRWTRHHSGTISC